ncbi:MAG: hypothetical protein LC124_03275 [Ignavibacteriales bacterium]|nr:hypothetical protein [Ignavibacteriales bacterium]
MKKHKLIFLLILVSIFLLITNCNSTEPPDDELKPGRRDYTWTVDTLNYPYATLDRIWGSSPTDVWAISPGDWDKSVSHFNGSSWFSYGVNGLIVPSSIFGFDWNRIFIGAQNGKVWMYNGTWSIFASLSKDGHIDIIFDNIWGKSSNDFFVFGAYPDTIIGGYNNTVIAHYLNNNWIMLNTSSVRGLAANLYRDNADGKLYVKIIKIGGAVHPDSTTIYEYLNESFKQLYSSPWAQGLQADISLINDEVYFILGNQIAKRVNDKFETFLQVNNNNFYQRIWGRNEKDIFLFMLDGLTHYNGTDIEYLFTLSKPRTQIFGAVLFEKEVFFLVYESQTNLNLIYHGKLN